ncbi:ATP-dependent DNA ligase [Streptomyces parvulus]
MWILPEPMLAQPVPDPTLPPGWAAEVKWDGFRAMLSLDGGQLVLRSRNGTPLAPSFPELRSGAEQLSDATSLDGEIVVWEGGRLAFERLQERLQRRGARAAALAAQWPAHFVAFDVLRLRGADTTRWPYRRRRAALEGLFAEQHLTAPWALCPSTTDPATVREWLTTWTVGVEGIVLKRLEGVYEPGVRGWRKYKNAMNCS